MSFLSPLMFALAVLLPAVVLLYMLKLRRQEVLVSSTFLWKKSLEDMHANAPFQKLVKNLLMFAQLIALAVIVFGLARPVLSGTLGKGRSLALLIDTSASMQATDVKPSRLEAARAEALKLVDGMTDRDEMMLVSFDAKPRILASLTKEKAVLRAALAEIRPTDAAGNIREALLIASSVLRNRPSATLVILSDGRCKGLDASVDKSVDVRYRRVGERGRNAGITAVDARPVEDDPSHDQLFVETRAVGDVGRGTLSLYMNGGLVDARKLAWEGGKPASVVFDVRGAAETQLKAVLGTDDDLAVDNTAYVVLGGRPRQKILLVSEGNYFLERLLNLEKSADLYKITPKDYAAKLATQNGEGPGDYALTVLDRWAPEHLAEGRYLCFGVVPPVEGFKALGRAERPVVLDWKRGHPLMRFANFSNLRVSKSIRWECPSWAQTLLESSEGPLIVLAQRGRLTVAAAAFDLFDTDWPFRLSFPIFVSNAIRTLGGEGMGESRALKPGEAIPWRTEVQPVPQALSVTLPDDRKESLPFHGEDTLSFAGTLKTGFYALTDGKASRTFGVSLRSAEESDTTPVDEKDFDLGGAKVVSGGQALEQHEIWPWFALGALALLCLEWAMYHRRWL